MTHLWIRTATAVLLAASLGACASTPRYPTVAGQAAGTGPQLATPAYPIREARAQPPAPVADASMADPSMADEPTADATDGAMPASAPRAASVVTEEALPDRPAPKDEISKLDVAGGEYAFVRVSHAKSALPPADAPGAKGKKGKKAEPAKGAALKGKVSPSKKAAPEKACTGRHCKAEASKASKAVEKSCKGKKCKAEPVKAAEKPCKGRHCKAEPKEKTTQAKGGRGRHSEEAAPAPVKSSAKATPGVIAGGAVVSADGPPVSYKVKSGDTVDGVADKLNTTRKQLVADNKLKSPFHLKLGQVLRGPASHGKAYVVQSGDTLYAIARRFSVDASDLADYNDIKASAALRPGRRLDLPPGFKDKGVPKAPAPPKAPVHTVVRPPVQQEPERTYPQPTPQPQPPVQQPAAGNPTTTQPGTVTPSRPQPYRPQPAYPTRPPTSSTTVPPMVDSAPPVSDSEIANLGRGRFSWPVRGEVISGYGPKGAGQRNDGIDLRAPMGTPVLAAGDGEVVYAGDQVPGFGNVVLIKHKDGWVTVYAHLARIDVKMRQSVMQGMQIGQVGNSGLTGEPQLHFEVRYSPSSREKAKAVNPSLVLPQ